ncbi:UNVERIFIED_CONTAM: hypothetical protein Sradi_0659700 [Sesamum radiatum]|uniref:CCHC-type domain-containing protein n=1 Tax=Sesamum radiatum TaxID=300843 RepID=A0AAW2VQJ2_SESRA
MDSGFNHLRTALSLTESEDDGVIIASNLWYSDSDTFDLCLVGRWLSHKPFHADILKSTLLLAFNPVRGMEFKLLDGNRFLLKFHHIVDRNRVLDGCPWSFDKNLLILNSIAMNENPQDVNLDWAAFHVHVHGLPLSKMSKDMARFIGDYLGRFIDVDADSAGHVWGSSMRLRVSLDVSKPLRRVLKLRTTLGDEQLLSFTYEKLPNFCYICGCLGHLSKFCELRFSENFIDPDLPSHPTSHPNLTIHTPLPSKLTDPPESLPHTASPSSAPVLSSPLMFPITHITTQTTTLTASCPILKPKKAPPRKPISVPKKQKQPETPSSITDLCCTPSPPSSKARLSLSDISNIPAAAAGSPAQSYDAAMLELLRARDPLHSSHSRGSSPHVSSLLGFSGRNQVGGLALLWNKSLSVQLQSFSHHHINVTVYPEAGSEAWRFSGFYGVADTAQRQEKKGGRQRPLWQIRRFREALASTDLYDLGYEGDPFTWCNQQPEPDTIYERLDRACADPVWKTRFPSVVVRHIPVTSSDHAAIMIDTENARQLPRPLHKPFRFEAHGLLSTIVNM